MKTLILYHNSACSKCRKTFEILERSGREFKVVEYLDHPPTETELDSLLKQLKMEPERLVRTGEEEYEKLASKGQLPRDRRGWIQLMIQSPILIERPIVSDGSTAVIGRPPEKVVEWLKSAK